MLFINDLEKKIFNRHQFIECDELIIISGYVGPGPIKNLSSLPISTTVIYGMYGKEDISYPLHNAFKHFHNSANRKILYSIIPVHSKCYIWRKNREVIYALIGSANFTTSGITTPFSESLAEVTSDTFFDLNNYLKRTLEGSISCDTVTVKAGSPANPYKLPSSTCDMVLYDPRKNEVPVSSGLNWGNSEKGNTSPGDGYVPIRTSHIRSYPDLFPPKQNQPLDRSKGRASRQNDSIELIWDDGTIMRALLEGTQPVDGDYYPKQLSSFPSKSTLGGYIRKRLGLSPSDLVKKTDLESYGRDYVSISLLQPGTYYVDFSI